MTAPATGRRPLVPEASVCADSDDVHAAFARLLGRLATRDGIAAGDLMAEGMRAWLRALADTWIGRDWRIEHLGEGPVVEIALCPPTPNAVQTTFEALQGLTAARGGRGAGHDAETGHDGVSLHKRAYARQQAGAYYTPSALIRLLLDRAQVTGTTRGVLDPACGPGAFLLAAADRLPVDRLYGIDVDPLAVACARVALALKVTARGDPPPELRDRLVCADALLDDALWDRLAPAGGFDAIVGNPPWERAKLQQVEWLTARAPDFRGLDAGRRKARLAELAAANAPVWQAFEAERRRRAHYAADLRRRYPETCAGDANLYAAFAALAVGRVAPDGRAALLVPSGIAADRTTSGLVRRLATEGRLAAFLDFENRASCAIPGEIEDRRPSSDDRAGRFFPGVDGRFRFAALCVTGTGACVRRSELAFARAHSDGGDGDKPLTLSPRALATLNPATGGLAIPRSRGDAALALRLHRRWPPLVDRRGDTSVATFPVRYRRMFDLTNDAHRFQPWARADADAWPLYEGKMVQAFDHRAASVTTHPGNPKRPAQPRRTTAAEHADPRFRPTPRYSVPAAQVRWPDGLDWAIGLKHVTSPTNLRTVIAAAVPPCAAANSLPLLLPAGTDPEAIDTYRRSAPLLLANLNARVLDWLARGKLQGQNLNLYILEQLPIIPPTAYDADVADQVRRELKRLCHTSHDLDGFAHDLGYPGQPLPWSEPRRRAARSRLDALYERLYRLTPAQSAQVATHFRVLT